MKRTFDEVVRKEYMSIQQSKQQINLSNNNNTNLKANDMVGKGNVEPVSPGKIDDRGLKKHKRNDIRDDRVVPSQSNGSGKQAHYYVNAVEGNRSILTTNINSKELEKSIEECCRQVIETTKTVSQLPDPESVTDAPDVYLIKLVKAQYGVDVKVKSSLELNNYFPSITEEQFSSYNMEVVTAARQNNVNDLKQLYEKKGRQSLDCVNRFGESLLHMACRRGFKDMVQFFLSEIKLNLRMRDDFGRTPLHDACWHPNAQLEIAKWIIEIDPSLLLVADKRGNTPFQYARSEDWSTWRKFLFENRSHLELLLQDPSVLAEFS